MNAPIRILGIDPGLRLCGWGIAEITGSHLTHIAHGVIAPPTAAPMAERLMALFDAMSDIIEQHNPDCAAIEEVFMAKNAGSALKLGQARAAAMLAPARAGLPVAEYAAREIKKAVVGVGGADKMQVVAMIGVLMPGCGAKADAADALAVAVTHAHTGLSAMRLKAAS